jgi:hypothetical protein
MSINNLYPDISPSLLLDFANVKKLDPRITFARASTGAYYDGQTVTKAEENLFSYSEDFTNSIWIKSSVSITANDTAAPDGTVTADKYQGSAVNLLYRSPPSAGTYAFSCYIKAGTATTATLSCTISLRGIAAEFNLSAGTTSGIEDGQNGSELGISADSASITNAANGWYRCVINGITINQVRSMVINSGNKSATSTGTIYLWGAQLEQRDSVTAYTPTTTQPITNYIPVLQTATNDVARFDHDPVTNESLGLLIEEQRTNETNNSEVFTSTGGGVGAWTANATVAPDGNKTADLWIPAKDFVDRNTSVITNSINGANAVVTGSVFVKKQSLRYAHIALLSSHTYYTKLFDLDTGEFVKEYSYGSPTQTSSIVTALPNGWYRISVSRYVSNTETNFRLEIGSTDVSNPSHPYGQVSYVADGISGMYFWGSQLETGSYPTSYIPTNGSTVTRAADSASMTGANFSDWYNPSQGTLYADVVFGGAVATGNSVAGITDGTLNNCLLTQYTTLTTRNIVRALGADQALLANNIVPVIGAPIKSAFAFTSNSFATSFNGQTVLIDTLGLMPTNVNQLYIGSLFSASQTLTGTIKKLSYYPARLSNEQLQSLTSS